MRLIKVLIDGLNRYADSGLFACGWKLDDAAIEQLQREAAEDGAEVDVQSSPPTFLGLPIQIVSPGPAEIISAPMRRRFVVCQHPERAANQWDVFDIKSAVALGAFYASEDEAQRECRLLEREIEGQ